MHRLDLRSLTQHEGCLILLQAVYTGEVHRNIDCSIYFPASSISFKRWCRMAKRVAAARVETPSLRLSMSKYRERFVIVHRGTVMFL
jgi:hypothetical protein